MELTMEYFDKVNESYFNMEKDRIYGYHQFAKTLNFDILKESSMDYVNDAISLVYDLEKDTTELEESKLKLTKLFRNREDNFESIYDTLENFTYMVSDKISEFNASIEGLYTGLADSSHMNVMLEFYNDYLSYICEESMFMLQCTESMYILTEADENSKEQPSAKVADKNNDSQPKTKESISEKGRKVFEKVWEGLRSFFSKLFTLFSDKATKIKKRDEAWLKNAESRIKQLDVSSIELDVYEGVSRPYSNIMNTLSEVANKIQALASKPNEQMYDLCQMITKKYKDSNGNLKQGYINYLRSGNVNKEVKIITIRGSQITNTLESMRKYCLDFIADAPRVYKIIKDGEKFVDKMEKEAKRRQVATESYCHIEECDYMETDLALCENYHVLLEADDKATPGVRNTGEAKHIANSMNDKTLSQAVKVLREDQIIVSATLTVAEGKYFENIKILRSLIK